MRLKPKMGWFLAFAAVYAALAGFVFWGTWSLDVVPIMPDHSTTYPIDHAWRCFRNCLEHGKLIPLDVIDFIGSPYFWLELKYVLALFLSALGMAYFCRGRGLSRPASYGAGLLLGFCGYWMTLFSAGHFGWFQWMAHGVFAFGLADRAICKGKLRHWLMLGAVVAWAGFNQQDLWLLFTVFTAIYFGWGCVRERKFPWKGMALSAIVFIIIGLPNFVDTLVGGALQDRKEQIARGENVTQKDSSETDKKWEFVTNWSMPIEDTVEFWCSRVNGDTSCPFVLSINAAKGVKPYVGALGRPMNAKMGNYRQHSLYVGLVTMLLALIGVVGSLIEIKNGKKINSTVIFFICAAIAFYLLSLGRYCESVYRVIFALPFGDLIRCPVKWHHLTEFSLVVLAAHGIEMMLRFKHGLLIACAVVLFGAADLAWNDKNYCAEVNVSAARRSNATMQMTIMPRQQFANPQVAAMVKAGQIVSIAHYFANPDYYVVGVIERPHPRKEADIGTMVYLLGGLSLLMSLGVIGLSIIKRNVVLAGNK